MWLLSTDRAELHAFHSPASVPGAYAILSHVWGKEEQSFQDIQALSAATKSWFGPSPRDLAGSKIRNCCVLAEKHGYSWVWIDTCCIDKSSSAELSEAINSMFHYYSVADVCFAYLGDLLPHEVKHKFKYSSWHKRGWTLQELISPRFVVFLSRDWEVFGTKADLAPQIQKISRIPVSVLTLQQDFRELSIAQRMSWAADRETTREEDRAYSLLGLFDINMSTLYGEGSKAFYRLQEELLKQYADTSLFAWSLWPRYEAASGRPPSRYLYGHAHIGESYLFAPSPDVFRSSGLILQQSPHKAGKQKISLVSRNCCMVCLGEGLTKVNQAVK